MKMPRKRFNANKQQQQQQQLGGGIILSNNFTKVKGYV